MILRYYEYTIILWNDIDENEEKRSGVISAISMSDAIEELKNNYGNNLIEIQMIKSIIGVE
jgi:hypothetical protein